MVKGLGMYVGVEVPGLKPEIFLTLIFHTHFFFYFFVTVLLKS